MDGETPGVTEAVQYLLFMGDLTEGKPVFPLIQVETGFLSRFSRRL